jgi:DNA-binding MarR family transcriptional regulator
MPDTLTIKSSCDILAFMSIRMSERELKVYLVFWDVPAGTFQTLPEIAEATGLPPLAVSRAIKSLEAKGVLTCQRDNRGVIPNTVDVIAPENLILLLPCAELLALIYT